MASPFLRVNISEDSTDFSPLVVEQGQPMLDKVGSNEKTLRPFLGRFLARPVRKKDFVGFHVCDDAGDVLPEIQCAPVSIERLENDAALKGELSDLRDKLDSAISRTKSPDDLKLLQRMNEDLATLIEQKRADHSRCHLFTYTLQEKNRLLWCWGYRRKDNELLAPVICSNPQCSLLFVNRGAGTPQCPACSKSVKPLLPLTRGQRAYKALIGMLVLAVCLAALLSYVLSRSGRGVPQDTFVAEPSDWRGPVGATVDVRTTLNAEGEEKDVTPDTVAVVEDPRILAVNRSGGFLARATGETVVHFYHSKYTTRATFHIELMNPDRVVLDPKRIDLGTGSTIRLRLIGEFKDGQKANLTEFAEWLPVEGEAAQLRSGRVFGVTPGEAVVRVRYRARTGDPYLSCEATVTVHDEEYTSLDLDLQPAMLRTNQPANLTATLKTRSGKERSALGSAQLEFEVEPGDIADIDGDQLVGRYPGNGTLTARFGSLTQSIDFGVKPSDGQGPPGFYVRPEHLTLIKGQLAELSVVSASSLPIELESRETEIVEVLSGLQLAARAPGTAAVLVRQGENEAEVRVEVRSIPFDAIAIIPQHISVPVGDSTRIRIVGRCEDGEEVDLTPDQIVVEEVPSGQVAEFETSTLTVKGHQATGPPERLVVRHERLRAEAVVDVVGTVVQVELTPPGPHELAVDHELQLTAFATSVGGNRLEISANQLEWKLNPESVDGLELDQLSGVIRASAPNAGPITVYARYQEHASNRVEITSVPSPPVRLSIDASRTKLLVGEVGSFRCTTTEPNDAEPTSLGPVTFESSDSDVLTVIGDTGAYRALSPGIATVSAKSPASPASATLQIQVFDPDDATLVLRPDDVRMVQGTQQEFELRLLFEDDPTGELIRFNAESQAVRIGLEQTDVAVWQPPFVRAIRPSPSVRLSAEYLTRTANATIQIDAPDNRIGDLKTVPSGISLAVGQTVMPHVMAKVQDQDEWFEVQPARVHWTVPAEGTLWTPAQNGLPPRLRVVTGATGSLQAVAAFGGREAALEVTVVPDPPPPSGELVVVRYPPREAVFVDERQVYSIMSRENGRLVPAADIEWPAAFESDHIDWEPPVLLAKRPGCEREFTVAVGDRTARFRVRTVPKPTYVDTSRTPAVTPDELRIVSSQGNDVTTIVGAEFDDFRVLGTYTGNTVDVTNRAHLIVASDTPDVLRAEGGKLIGINAGQATVLAEFGNLRTADGLKVSVLEGWQSVAGITIRPPQVELAIGDSATVRVFAYRESEGTRTEIGEISSLAALHWKSANDQIVRVAGGHLHAVGGGETDVSVRLDDLEAETLVKVTDRVDAPIVAHPAALSLEINESMGLGRDVLISRDSVDLSDAVTITSSDESVVGYNQSTRSVKGKGIGQARLVVTYQDEVTEMPVTVRPKAPERAEFVVIEPASAQLEVGEQRAMRVYTSRACGGLVDRTDSALFESSDSDILFIQGNQIVAFKEGEATVFASVPGHEIRAEAPVTVTPQEFDRLIAIPSEFELETGQERQLRFRAASSSRWRDLSPIALDLSVAGDNPNGVSVSSLGRARGLEVGEARIVARLGDSLQTEVPVTVTEPPPLEDLQVLPQTATVQVDDWASLVVLARRGRSQPVLTADDGVLLDVADPAIATAQGLSVRGHQVGTTKVTARFRDLLATATLHVMRRHEYPPPSPVDLRFVPDSTSLLANAPPSSFRVMRVLNDGTEQQVHGGVSFEVEPDGVVQAGVGPSGFEIRPLQPGRATISVSDGAVTSRVPLVVGVGDRSTPGNDLRARLVIRPDPLELDVGDQRRLPRAQLVFEGGQRSVYIDYAAQIQNESIATVEEGRIKAREAGQTWLIARPAGVAEEFQDLETSIPVLVHDPPPRPSEPQLHLAGPSTMSVDSQSQFRVRLLRGASVRDVTHAATLVINRNRDQLSLAEAQPGCVLLAKRPGFVNLRARYEGRISNPAEVRIIPGLRRYARLAVEIDERPMIVGESRGYRVWGYPHDGGAQRDLTHLIGRESGPEVAVRGTPSTAVVHQAPYIRANEPGEFVMAARLDDAQSDVVKRAVVPAGQGLQLYARPAEIAVAEGRLTPALQVFARWPNGDERIVAAEMTSANNDVLAPAEGSLGRFVGRSVGRTEIVASYGGERTAIRVLVTGDRFREVNLTDAEPLDGEFTIQVEVIGSEQGTQYRVATVNGLGTDWGEATASSDRPGLYRYSVESPKLAKGPPNTVYDLVIESRRSPAEVQRFPCSFRLIPTYGIERE